MPLEIEENVSQISASPLLFLLWPAINSSHVKRREFHCLFSCATLSSSHSPYRPERRCPQVHPLYLEAGERGERKSLRMRLGRLRATAVRRDAPGRAISCLLAGRRLSLPTPPLPKSFRPHFSRKGPRSASHEAPRPADSERAGLCLSADPEALNLGTQGLPLRQSRGTPKDHGGAPVLPRGHLSQTRDEGSGFGLKPWANRKAVSQNHRSA